MVRIRTLLILFLAVSAILSRRRTRKALEAFLGMKIAATTSDGTTECYVEIEDWNDTAEQAWLWVKVPTISNTSEVAVVLWFKADLKNRCDLVFAIITANITTTIIGVLFYLWCWIIFGWGY